MYTCYRRIVSLYLSPLCHLASFSISNIFSNRRAAKEMIDNYNYLKRMLVLNFNPFPNLSSQRFNLRAPVLQDDEAIAALRSDPLVNQFLNRAPTSTVAEARQFIEKIRANIDSNQSLYWVITTKESDDPIGTICYWNIEPEFDQAEIGYELRSAFFRKGIMREVIPVVIQFGFEQLHLQKITATLAENNERSIRLLELNHFIKDDLLREKLEKEDDLSGLLCYSLSKSV